MNLLHRLKYLTNTIVEVLEEDVMPSLVHIISEKYRYAMFNQLVGEVMKYVPNCLIQQYVHWK